MAQVWMHNGFLQVEGEKMAKSAGNFITIHDLLQEWPGEAVRLAMLTTHYRQPFNWTEVGVREASRTLDHWYEITETAASDGEKSAEMLAALQDDLNTPKALSVLHEVRHEAAKGDAKAAACLKASARFLGLLSKTADEWINWRPASVKVDEELIASLISARDSARKSRDFAEADRIRDELAEMGIAIKDGPEGTTWEVGR
jgi:cysteinyl-tRNA synthetase